MPAKTITSQLGISPSFGPNTGKRSNLLEPKQQSPRSPLEIDRLRDGPTSKRSLPEPSMKRVSFPASERIPSGTQHTEETVSTIREEQYYDCDQEVEEPGYNDDSDEDHSELNDEVPPMMSHSFGEAKTMATTSTRNRRRRKIRWSGQVRVQEIRHINNMPESEIEAVWMSPAEYKMIKNGAKTTVLMMMAGETFREHDPDFCARGLEFRTRKGNKIRAANKLKARSAVLNEQDLQREEGFHDPEFIAMASLDVSFEVREQARKRGEKDARAIAEYMRDVHAMWFSS